MLTKANQQKNFLSKLESFNLVELPPKLWIQTLKKSSVSEEGLVTALVTLNED
jgi:hypothetical protein